MWNRCKKKNKNSIVIFNGDTGSGKSWAGLRSAIDIAKMFETPFTIKGNVEFNFSKLLEKMNKKENRDEGTVFLMEEVGAIGSGATSMEWQSAANRFFFSFLQTSRHRKQVLIMNCPSLSNLAKGARELVNFQFESLGVNMQKKVSIFKPFFLQVNRRTGKIYFKYIRYNIKGIPRYMSRMEFRLPPQNIIDEYEIAKLRYTTMLNREIVRGNNVKQKIFKKSNKKELVTALMLADKGTAKIAELLGITSRAVRQYKAEIRGKSKES